MYCFTLKFFHVRAHTVHLRACSLNGTTVEAGKSQESRLSIPSDWSFGNFGPARAMVLRGMPVAEVTVSAASGISLASAEEQQRQELARHRPLVPR
jgi:hypothetical protein